jgi:acyl-CoA thioesterase-1
VCLVAAQGAAAQEAAAHRLALAAAGAGKPATFDAAGSEACNLPAELITPDIPLPRVAAALTTGKPVDVLAIGSGSTVGDAGGSAGPAFAYRNPTASFPYRMIEALQALRANAQFTLTVKGGRDMTTDTMLEVLRQALAAHHYDLVVWQTGTVEAVRGLRPEAMRDALEDGIEAASADGADVVVVDPQFSRFLRANTDVAPYVTTLQQTAAVNGAALFHRFDLTQDWSNSGEIDPERVSPSAREHTIMLLNICLGRALAKFVLTGASEVTH